MPSILSDEDKQTVKRTVPKSNNKIHAVGVAIAFHLAEVLIANAIDRAFKAAPQRQLWCGIWLDLLFDVHEKYLLFMRQALD